MLRAQFFFSGTQFRHCNVQLVKGLVQRSKCNIIKITGRLLGGPERFDLCFKVFPTTMKIENVRIVHAIGLPPVQSGKTAELISHGHGIANAMIQTILAAAHRHIAPHDHGSAGNIYAHVYEFLHHGKSPHHTKHRHEPLPMISLATMSCHQKS